MGLYSIRQEPVLKARREEHLQFHINVCQSKQWRPIKGREELWRGRIECAIDPLSCQVSLHHYHHKNHDDLQACITSLLQEEPSLSNCKLTHAHIIRRRSRLQNSRYLENMLITMYAHCGAVDDARFVFDTMLDRNIVSWNAIISAYARNSQPIEALHLFRHMLHQGPIPNRATYASVLRVCNSHEDLTQGRAIHALVTKDGFESDLIVGTTLVSMYSKCGSLIDACSIFQKLKHRNVVSWTAMIAAYIQHDQSKEALVCYRHMQQEGLLPNKVTFLNVLGACNSPEALAEGRLIHACIVDTGLESDALVGTALIVMYAKCGRLEDARAIFGKLHQPDVAAWNAMLAAYVQHGHCNEGLRLYRRMQQHGIIPSKISFINALSACDNPVALAEGKLLHARILTNALESDVVLRNAIISMYGKCGSLKDAILLFDNMYNRDAVSWTTMIALYTQYGHGGHALQLFRQMQQEGIEPTQATFISALCACATVAALEEGRLIHSQIVDLGLESGDVGISLVSMYSKCGSLVDARKVFGKMNQSTVISWNVMISAYNQHGYGIEALQLFQQMQWQGVKPDLLTFVAVLSACSHAGLVNDGFCYFVLMSRDYGIIPVEQHYNCMIDLLGRAGQLDEAEDFIFRMQSPPNASAWKTMLGACRMHGDIDRGKHLAEHATNMDPQNSSSFVLVSNIFAAGGMWQDVALVRKLM